MTPLECGIIFDGIPEGAISRKVGLIWGIPVKGTSPDDPMFLQIYDVADRHDIVVMIHPDEDQQDNIERALAHISHMAEYPSE